MKNITVILALVAVFFIGCKTSQNSNTTVTELKNNQFKGVVQELTVSSGQLRTSMALKDIYFTTNSKNYFIKFSEGYVTKEELMKYLGKEIVIKGEIKNGAWEEFPPSSTTEIKTLKAPRSGEYIILEKIYKK